MVMEQLVFLICSLCSMSLISISNLWQVCMCIILCLTHIGLPFLRFLIVTYILKNTINKMFWCMWKYSIFMVPYKSFWVSVHCWTAIKLPTNLHGHRLSLPTQRSYCCSIRGILISIQIYHTHITFLSTVLWFFEVRVCGPHYILMVH